MTTINSITPVTGRKGEVTNARIIGSGFSTGYVPYFIDHSSEVIQLSNVNVVSGNVITFDIPGDLDSGLYHVRLVSLTDATDLTLFNNAFIVMPSFPEYPYSDNFNSIMNRMLNRLPDNYDKREGQTFYNILSPVALEIAEQKILMKNITDLSSIEKTSGSYLDFKAIEFGLTRLNPTRSFGTVNLESDSAFTLANGSIEFATTPLAPDNTTTTFVLHQSVTGVLDNADSKYKASNVNVVAKEEGFSSNFNANSIDKISTSGYTAITVASSSVMKGGADLETDEDFRIRILRRMFSFPRAGNIADYERWILEATDYAGKIKVVPTPDDAQGNAQGGKVDIHFLLRDETTPSTSIISEVQNYIFPTDKNGVAPIGAEVTVSAAGFTNIHVKATITAVPGFDISVVADNVETAIREFLTTLQISESVKAVQLGSAIFSVTGVNTLSGFALSKTNTTPTDTETTDITIDIDKTASAGTITVTQST